MAIERQRSVTAGLSRVNSGSDKINASVAVTCSVSYCQTVLCKLGADPVGDAPSVSRRARSIRGGYSSSSSSSSGSSPFERLAGIFRVVGHREHARATGSLLFIFGAATRRPRRSPANSTRGSAKLSPHFPFSLQPPPGHDSAGPYYRRIRRAEVDSRPLPARTIFSYAETARSRDRCCRYGTRSPVDDRSQFSPPFPRRYDLADPTPRCTTARLDSPGRI